MPQPDGSMCQESCECGSDACFVLGPLGGLCGECIVDADCPDGGCTIPNPLSEPPEGAVCNDGSLGGGCQTDAACQDPLICVTVIDIPGILTSVTCSECEADADCVAGLCSPDYEIQALSGHWICVDVGSVPNGGACDFLGSGDAACASGHCAIGDLLGVTQIGVCGECEDDGDCGVGICEPPVVDLMSGLSPSICV